MKQKLVAALLVGGTAVLGVGTGVVAALPSSRSASPVTSKTTTVPAKTVPSHHALPVAASPPSAPLSAAVAPKKGRSKPTPALVPPTTTGVTTTTVAPSGDFYVWSNVTYSVKPGDTLASIEQWFDAQGYGALFAANAAVIGPDPVLFPGELISISNGVMTLQRPA